MLIIKKPILFLALIIAGFYAEAQDVISYQLPPKAMVNLLLAKPTPNASIDSKAEWMLLMDCNSYPFVEELARPELRIAGLRINPNNFALSGQLLLINNLY